MKSASGLLHDDQQSVGQIKVLWNSNVNFVCSAGWH